MKIYLVGGAVRDELLGLPVTERDWVVVGATVAELLAKGFRQVGKDFPVFLHPETKEEYALARKERKIGLGYTGFDFDTTPTVTLEEDLKRRDLTINAMAKTLSNELVDPYHGKHDLEHRILRHVSAAFVEDPVRILRVARFAARFAYLNFSVAKETMTLMQNMVTQGEVNALVAERVWKELERALMEKNPEMFFTVLNNCGALDILFPELVANSAGLATLAKIAILTHATDVRFAAVFHGLKEVTFKKLAERYRIPTSFREITLLIIKHHRRYAQHTKKAEDILMLLTDLDAFRRAERFRKFLLLAFAITGIDHMELLQRCFVAAEDVDSGALTAQGYVGKALGDAIYQERLQRIQHALL